MDLRRLALTLTLTLIAAPVCAQHAAHPEIVAAVKAQLEARGVNLRDCGAFEITKRVAWTLRGDGAGLLAKAAGYNCDGFASDIIVYPDGAHYDILTGNGETNGPTWNFAGTVDPARWRAPADPDPIAPPISVGLPPPTMPSPPALPAVDLSPVLNRLAAIEAQMVALQAAQQSQRESERQEHETIRGDIKSFRDAAHSALQVAMKYVLPAVAAWFGGKHL